MNFYDKLAFVLMSMSLSLLIDSLFIMLIQVYNEKREIKKIETKLSLDKVDYLYYRDVIDGYHPAVLTFCHKKYIKLDDVIIATLLDLERKNKIMIQNGQIDTIADINEMDITEYEKIILLYCIKGEEINKKELYTKIKEETVNQGLI